MLRNILRTSRWLTRRPINSYTPILLRQLPKETYESMQVKYVCPKQYSTNPTYPQEEIDPAAFEEICSETLESLCDYFEEIIEAAPNLKGADVTYSDGVLTVALGSNYGTYVINRQSPNKQIWLSSPISGPKRYDLITKDGGFWIYKHDGISLHRLLQEEISKIVSNNIDFKKCAHSLV